MSKNKDYIQAIENAERRFFVAPVTIEKREGDAQGPSVIEGFAAKFNSRTNIGDFFEEELLPGAFDDVLNDDVRCLFNHNPNYILARSINGKGTLTLSVDDEGLKYRYETPNRSYAKDLEDAIASGDVSQSSFAFMAKEVIWTERSEGLDLRQIVKVRNLYDVSPVTYPAYQDATVGKRSLDTYKDQKEIDSDAKAFEKKENEQRLSLSKARCLIYNYNK
jgi:HK97 family phage prohead protease